MRLFSYILFAAFALASSEVFGQEFEVAKSDSVAKIDGELYTIHTVSAKQTLFSIAKAYQVKLSRIAFDNPGVLDGLKLGQALKILKSAEGETIPDETETQALELDGEYVLYTVPKQQTLYAISKEYNTTISAILDANPELVDGLKVGSTIRVPVPKMLGEQPAGKVEMIGLPAIVKHSDIQFTEVLEVKKRGGKIALMLPLYLDDNDTVAVHRLEEEPEKIFERSEIGLAFYEGFLLALDTLRKAGFEVDVTVFDTENRPWKVRQLVKQQKLKGFDLIIGPLYGKVFNEVADYAYQNCIPLVSPTLKGDGVVAGNDYVLKMIPSEEAMVAELGRYLAFSDSTENIILHYGAENELGLVRKFRKAVSGMGMQTAMFRELNIYQASSDSIRNSLSVLGRSNLIILSTNEVRLAKLMRNMSNWLEEARVVTFVPNAWQKFNNVEMDYFDRFRVHLSAPFHVDYQRLDAQNFVRLFRQKFKAEPSTFAFRGYDLAMHFVTNLGGIIEHGPSYLESVLESGLQSNFRWERVPNGGLENAGSHVVDYTGFELKLAVD